MNVINIIPVSHELPVYPSSQIQLCPLTSSIHVAPCWHGDDEHSLMSGNIVWFIIITKVVMLYVGLLRFLHVEIK